MLQTVASEGPWELIRSIFRTMELKDIIDILMVSFLVYKAVQIIRETRAMQLLKGILALVILYVVVDYFSLETMKYIMELLFQTGLFALLVVFQPELRRVLEQVGRTKISDLNVFGIGHLDAEQEERQWRGAISAISDASNSLSRQKIGALMVIEMKTKLGEIIKTGTIIDSIPTMELIGNIFFPNSPLHDGAMIIRSGKLYAAGCYLPLSDNHEISRELGTRHRAGLGMSENSDAIVIIVSEETGVISVARNGVLKRDYTPESIKELLLSEILPDKKSAEQGEKKSVFRRGKNKTEQ